MNKRRLLALADFLETKVPKKEFNFAVVCGDAGDYEPAVWLDKPLSPGCGAVGCAIGWAPSMRCFKREGWTYDRGLLCRPGGGYVAYEDAAMEMFDISFADAHDLFTPWDGHSGLPNTATPKQVAKHIRKFVAEHS